MPRIYSKYELHELVEAYHDPETQAEATQTITQLLTDFANNLVDIEQLALPEFNDLIEVVGMTTNENGETILNEVGARASARMQSIMDNLENSENQIDDNRIHTLTSDQNQIKFDLLTLSIYKQMHLVSDGIDANNLTPSQVSEIITSVNLTNDQRREYSDRFISEILEDPELFELVPPKLLTDAYIFARDKYLGDKTEENKKRVLALSDRIDYLIKFFARKIDYFIADPSNIADLYKSYRHMCAVRGRDLQTDVLADITVDIRKDIILPAISTTVTRLEEVVSIYSEMWNMKNLRPENAEELDRRWQEIATSLENVEITDEILSTLSKYKFLDENGNPLPQFLDENGNPTTEFRPGYKLNPNGRLNRIISLAKTDVNMRNVGDLETEVQDMNLGSELEERIPWKMAEISVPDQVIAGIETKPAIMLTQEEVDEFWDSIEAEGGEISDTGYQAALDAQVNQAAGFAGMMAERVGNDKPIVMRPFESVQDIDTLATTRSEQTGAQERTKKISFFKRIVKNFSAAAVMSAGLTFIGKATGVAYAGAAVGTAIGIGNMIYQGFKWRKEQKKAGRPHGLKAFFSDKRNWAPAVTSGLGIAAVISMATGNPELAAGFGIGAMAVGGTSSAVATYKDAVNSGYTRGQALAGAIAVAGSVIAGGFAGRAAMNGIVNYVNNNTDSTLFRTEHEVVNSHETTQRVYQDGVIEHHEKMMLDNNWETPQSLDAKVSGLMDSGLTHDDAVRYLVAWHDATDHNLGPGYFNNIGMGQEALAALRGSISGNIVNLTPESIAAFEHFNPHISAINTVGYIPGAPTNTVLPANATYDANGVLIPGNEVYSTYVEHSHSAFADVPVITNDVTSVFTPNELAFPAGIGMLGIYEPRVVPKNFITRMRERIGALADRGRRICQNNGIEDVPPITPIQPIEPDRPIDPDQPVEPHTPVEPNPPVIRRQRPNTQPVNDGPENPTGNQPTENGQEETGTTPTQRGFFAGLRRLQANIHELRMQRIRNRQERELLIQQGEQKMKKQEIRDNAANMRLRAREAKKTKKEYEDLSIEDIDELTEKDIATLASLNESLKERLSKKRTKLIAELSLADLKQRHEIKQRLAEIDALYEELKTLKKIKGKASLEEIAELKRLEAKIKVLEAKGEIEVETTRAKGQNKVNEIAAEGRTSRVRNFGRAIAGLFRGLGDTTQEDITSASNAAKLAQKKFAKAKTDAARKLWLATATRLTEIMENTELTEEQKRQISETVIREAMEQSEKSK